jgi:hypothetical protein
MNTKTLMTSCSTESSSMTLNGAISRTLTKMGFIGVLRLLSIKIAPNESFKADGYAAAQLQR